MTHGGIDSMSSYKDTPDFIGEDYAELLRSGSVVRWFHDAEVAEAWRPAIRRRARADRLSIRTYLRAAQGPRKGQTMVFADVPNFTPSEADMQEAVERLNRAFGGDEG